MRNFDRIIEKTFEILPNYNFAKTVLPFFLEKAEELPEDSKYAHVVYIDNGKKPPTNIMGWLTYDLAHSEDKISFKTGLKLFLEKYPDYSLFDIAHFADLYFYIFLFQRRKINEQDINEMYLHKFRKHKIADDILADSKGLLLWNYQIENLFSLFYEPGKGREAHMKINAQEADIILEQTKKLKLSDDLSLYDIISERMVLKRIFYLSIKRSFALYSLFKNER